VTGSVRIGRSLATAAPDAETAMAQATYNAEEQAFFNIENSPGK